MDKLESIFESCNTRYGQMYYLKHDMYIGKSLKLYGEFSEIELSFLAQLIRPGMTVFDIGANIGTHSVAFSRFVGPRGRVYAFEPQRILHQILCANLIINQILNVNAAYMGLGKTNYTASLPRFNYAAEFNFGGISIDTKGPQDCLTEPVTIAALDSFTFESCHFMKIDVEGFESQVILGALQTIEKHRPILYVENDRKEKSEELIKLIKSLNYKLWWHTPPMFNPDNYMKSNINVFGNIVSVNMLAIPKERNAIVNNLIEVDDCNT